MARPEQLEGLIDEEALQRARDKRRKVDTCVSEKVSITKRMYDALDTCIKSIGKKEIKIKWRRCVRVFLIGVKPVPFTSIARRNSHPGNRLQQELAGHCYDIGRT